MLKIIKDSAFENLNLKSIKIPKNVSIIEDNAFIDCIDLDSVEFDNESELHSIGCYSFCNTSISTILIPYKVEEIKMTQNEGGRNSYEDWYECGRFGHGSDCGIHQGFWKGGGGGGGFYGGGSGGDGGPGGGGSGYINTSILTNTYMYGYNVPTSSSSDTRTYSTSQVSSSPISNYAKQKDRYARITPLYN